jgi:hypothetical protein
LIQDALPRCFTAGRVSARSPFPGNTDRKMLENFTKINQFTTLVKQQLGSLFRISFLRPRESAGKPVFFLQHHNRSPQFF